LNVGVSWLIVQLAIVPDCRISGSAGGGFAWTINAGITWRVDLRWDCVLDVNQLHVTLGISTSVIEDPSTRDVSVSAICRLGWKSNNGVVVIE
jgi:hypothetical protein